MLTKYESKRFPGLIGLQDNYNPGCVSINGSDLPVIRQTNKNYSSPQGELFFIRVKHPRTADQMFKLAEDGQIILTDLFDRRNK